MATYDLTSIIPSKILAGDILNCPYSGTYKSITLPKGTYQLECWGASGATGAASIGMSGSLGLGGYSIGTLSLEAETTAYLYAGGEGQVVATSGVASGGGFNGGGNAYAQNSNYSGGGGGGASDIRIGSTSLYARIIVAGGSGGRTTGGSGRTITSGAGGGTSGGVGSTGGSGTAATGGSQTAGGTSGYRTDASNLVNGSFGQGGSANQTSNGTAGGGGGWYGGGGASWCGAAGGSGYVYTASTASNYPSGCLLDSTMYLTDASTSAGNTSFTSTSGSTETGHSGDGYVRITVISVEGGRKWKLEETYDFSYTGAVQTQILTKGKYIIECWGAQGGYSNSSSYPGGKGGYSVGELMLTESTTLYIYVGGKGTNSSGSGAKAGGFNGGGNAYASTTYYNAAGGGASDVRIGQDSLYARVIVAGGGGGAGSYSSSYRYTGGYGGGASGGTPSQYSTSYKAGTGGSQTTRGSSYYGSTANSITYGTLAVFGTGGGRSGTSTSYYITGGGGGWYGGGYSNRGAAGGGSGYVYTSDTASNYPSGCLLNSSYYLDNAETKAGNVSIPSTSGSTETGHAGNGYVRIRKYVSEVPFRMKVNGTIKEATEGYVKVNGEWKEILSIHIKKDGEWISN